MFEKRILRILHELNVEFLEKQKIEGFNIFFKEIIKSSHLFIRFFYFILIKILFFFFILMKIFFLSKKKELFLFKKIILLLNNVIILKEILKFIKVYSIIYNYD